jgi:transposase-like protein
MARKWMGTTPTTCQACGATLVKAKAFYDAVIQGRWGIICHACFTTYRCRLGTGAGQKYDMKTLEKIAG